VNFKARDHNISFIAHYTAQAWVREQLPWAFRFDTLRGRLFYDLVDPLFSVAARAGFTTPPDFLVQRHRIIDALVTEARPRQVVELAGGFCPRCLALSDKLGVRTVDVDLPEVVALKASRIGDDAPAEYRQTSLDLVGSRDYVHDLGAALSNVAPTVVITEGILPYFSRAISQHVFDEVVRLLRQCGGGTYLTDIHHQERIDTMALGRLFRSALHLVARSPKYPMIRNFDEAEAMLRRAGFDRVTAHHPRDFNHLGLTVRRRGSGLRIYEAVVEGQAPCGGVTT
jgi:O-methyltransferase involved in polyketide biosynthesis